MDNIEEPVFAGDTSPSVEGAKRYLRQYGYLPDGTDEPGAAEGAELDYLTSSALKSFQKFHGLLTSGHLDPATLALMQQPRCGVDDALFILLRGRWEKADLTYSVENVDDGLSFEQVRGACGQAFALWEAHCPLRFREVAANATADIRIRFAAGDHGDGSPFDGPGGTYAHAFFPPPNGGSLAGDAHFDSTETWTVAVPPQTGSLDLVTIAAHEFGHSIGLGHISDRSALMYPYYLGPHRYLAASDANAIGALYANFAAVIFYEGNFATQDVVHLTSDSPGQNFRPRQNDEARSARLRAVRAGCVIRVFDDPHGRTNDDYCVITVKRAAPEIVVGSFERSYETGDVRVEYRRKNGLDGKVSRVTIS